MPEAWNHLAKLSSKKIDVVRASRVATDVHGLKSASHLNLILTLVNMFILTKILNFKGILLTSHKYLSVAQ